jgi:hypothetical protein
MLPKLSFPSSATGYVRITQNFYAARAAKTDGPAGSSPGKNFSENYPPFGHVPSKVFDNRVLGRRKF